MNYQDGRICETCGVEVPQPIFDAEVAERDNEEEIVDHLICTTCPLCEGTFGWRATMRTMKWWIAKQKRRWYDMNRRCHDPTSPDYPDYGGRGAYVCECHNWRTDFESYYQNLITTISVELNKFLDLDVTFQWERVGDPEPDTDGEIPEKDDFRITVGLGIEF